MIQLAQIAPVIKAGIHRREIDDQIATDMSFQRRHNGSTKHLEHIKPSECDPSQRTTDEQAMNNVMTVSNCQTDMMNLSD